MFFSNNYPVTFFLSFSSCLKTITIIIICVCVSLYLHMRLWRSEDNLRDLRVSALQSVCACDGGAGDRAQSPG